MTAIAFSQNGIGGFGPRRRFGLALCSARYALMAACRSVIGAEAAAADARRVILEKKFSTALLQEAISG